MSDAVLKALGKVIQEKANAKYKSKLEFAYACDIDEKSIRRILKGEQNFSLHVFLKISSALGVKMSDLLLEVNS
ncbi:MAG: helix-turn-helix transcriptional regulator [Flavobacterium sp.]|nr:helix-turn-helix transcriptional regulator [Flavobacterium sp.]